VAGADVQIGHREHHLHGHPTDVVARDLTRVGVGLVIDDERYRRGRAGVTASA
jgi:hypothetical protein